MAARYELAYRIGLRLQNIAEKRDDLITEQEARDYFLRIGRITDPAFISNAQAKNDFVYDLKRELQKGAVAGFITKIKTLFL